MNIIQLNQNMLFVYGQLRSGDIVIEKLDKFLINELQADLYLVVQDSKTDIVI